MKRTTVHQCVLLVLMQQLFARRASKLAFAWALLSSSVGGSVTGFPAPCSCNGASNIQHTLSGRFSAASGMIFGCFFYSTNLLRLLRLAPNKVWPAFVFSDGTKTNWLTGWLTKYYQDYLVAKMAGCCDFSISGGVAI
ncbi:hypothetical protein EDB81DRAFT_121786 [Dactylonectria macrodidyma]|uniref:Secreted protein n=1 Tax=Dactylonectria macrodidyma TaxID=307937 RepID=A0A9P9IW47_9HYPO|nr:hypothetical protein EDB81DRAFT_121786 [Dactylonectria macrodidyma]